MDIMTDTDTTRKPVSYRLADLLAAFQTDAEVMDTARKTGKLLGPITGLEPLDYAISYRLMPGLHALTGNSGGGKTALAWQIAADCGFPALFVSCEIGPLEMFRRHVSRTTSTWLDALKNPKSEHALSLETLMQQARTACEYGQNIQLVDATQGTAGTDYLADLVRMTKEHTGGPVLLIIDSLHTWTEGLQGQATEYERLNYAIKELRTLALQEDIPLLYIAEQSRAVNREAAENGTINAGAGSRKIEYGAETQISIQVDLKPDSRDAITKEYPGKLHLTKNRHGRTGTWNIRFHGGYQRVRVEE